MPAVISPLMLVHNTLPSKLLASGTTLLQAIATARGYSPYANEKKVTITRQEKISQYNMKEIEKDPSLDIKIEAGDVIKVWTRWY